MIIMVSQNAFSKRVVLKSASAAEAEDAQSLCLGSAGICSRPRDDKQQLMDWGWGRERGDPFASSDCLGSIQGPGAMEASAPCFSFFAAALLHVVVLSLFFSWAISAN
jgi:hypothetical protein